MNAMTKFSAHILTSCFPINRSELFETVTKDLNSDLNSNGSVERLWIFPGHVFVSLEDETKLVTFDCKPVSQQHAVGYGSKHLDLTRLKPGVLDILLTPGPACGAFIVQQNGHVQCWQFTSLLQWSAVADFDLCDKQGSRVTNICLHQERNMIFWCEQLNTDEESYRICSKNLPEDLLQLQTKVPSSNIVLDCCPYCSVLPMQNGILVVPRYTKGQVRVCLLWKPSVMELVSVTTVIGTTVRNQHDKRGPLSFSEVVHSCLHDISEIGDSEMPLDLGVKLDVATGDAYLLHSDGLVYRFHAFDTEDDSKQSISVNTLQILMPDKLLHTDNTSRTWSVHKNIIAIATGINIVRLYSALEGQLIYEFTFEEGTTLNRMALVRSPAILFGVLTSTGVRLIQGGRLMAKSTKPHVLPVDKQFQTEAFKVALLAQQRSETPNEEVTDQLEQLFNHCKDLHRHQPLSQLSATVGDYIQEFWQLEEQASCIGKLELSPYPSVYNTTDMVKEAVAKCRSLTSEAAMSEMIWLSQKYPSEMLQVLLGNLDVDKDLTLDDTELWQSRFGLDTNDSITFECICRLLYQKKPQSLVTFVRNAQFVSEQAQGVSAFIRKKHKLQYYVRAMECLPKPENSNHPQEAAFAKAQIILIGAAEHGPELGLRFLLRHNEWSEAIQLLQQVDNSTPQYTSLFFLLLEHFIEMQVLSEYAPQVFSLLTSWKSFLPALKVMSDSTAIQSAMSSTGLFCSGPPDIPISAFLSHLMALLSDHK